MAFGSPPETGASIMTMPFSFKAAQISCAAPGAIELMSTTIVPGFAPSMTPSLPSTASRTFGELGSMVMIRSLLAATSLFEVPGLAPSATRSSNWANLSYTVKA
jgi:hypothetical protein